MGRGVDRALEGALALSGPGVLTHEAILYRGLEGFLEAASPFLAQGVERGEPTMVAVCAPKIAALIGRVGRSPTITYVDMEEVGRNPMRIIPAWRDFVAANPDAAALRGIGEPVWAGRSADEVDECQRHEALVNLALADAPLHLLCPYDVDTLAADVVRSVGTTHPAVGPAGDVTPSARYRGEAAFDPAAPLSPSPRATLDIAFDRNSIVWARRYVGEMAARAGLDVDRTDDIVTAVNELMANSVEHGGGSGVLRSWVSGESLVFEVEDSGHVDDPLAGRVRPDSFGERGRGLWIVNQLVDLVQLRSAAGGTMVRAHVRVGAS
jgi:anti-sigma regulatory factor (Ser/Thr protein kinase)